MAKADVFAAVGSAPAYESLLQRARDGGVLPWTGVVRSAHAFLAALLAQRYPHRPIVLVAESLKAQERLHADLTTWLNVAAHHEAADKDRQHRVTPRFFPAWDILPHESKLPHADVISERLETLIALLEFSAGGPVGLGARGKSLPAAPRLVVTANALQQRTFAGAELAKRTRTLKRGQTLNPLDLIEWLEEVGYEPETQVASKGQLAWRGGIVDVWSLSSPWPVRLEFFGDELESLREFDPHSQTSREQISEAIIPPAGELSLLKQRIPKWVDPPAGAPAETKAGLASLLDYLPDDALIVLSEPAELSAQAERYAQQVPAGDPFHFPWVEFLAEAQRRKLTWVELSEAADGSLSETDGETAEGALAAPVAPRGPRFDSLDAYRPIGATLPDPQVAQVQRREFFQQLHRWLRQGQTVHVFCNTAGEQQRFQELWAEYGLAEAAEAPVPAAEAAGPVTCPSGLSLHLGSLARGFLAGAARVVVVTDAEIYGRYKVARSRRLTSPHAQAMRSAFEVDFSEFEEGDYVVHLQHGIGLFRGLKTLPPAKPRTDSTRLSAAESAHSVSEGGQECLVVEFAARDSGEEPPRLYVPVSEAHLISKYVGAGKARPQLNTLGGARWTKAKQEAERAVRDLAADLLRVQASRSVQSGHAFSADTNWQREFEAAFEFEETPDQLTAIEAVKRDMEAGKPMDRLLCGDVGFGKTEVALRAAFKALMGGKQVALLVPTTVLAQQHYNSFRERMAGFPVRIELLSRFRTPKQQRAAMEAAANGTVDIVIGTHRIVSADVQFKDLGLVIVDEEQKFGVKHKEQFKLLRTTVDVLTLSATPIPRTLNLALTGARDLSTLETPPQDRLPVETVVGNYDERVVRDALRRELNRGGQVYFLHNRVSTIEGVALKLKALVPDARVVIGHGQMAADDLEKVMTQFVNGEADVLVSTTIIESGLDIPNANTMIIDRADRFGLSELYQLRGRVGRYKHQAYCYLLLPRHAQLLTEARKRMSAIKQYSALGSGFKIAMRDLEIRGAGNLLGAQQSGHITAVGFDLFCQLLKQSVAALKGEKVVARAEVRLSLGFLAMNPGEENQGKKSLTEAAELASSEPNLAQIEIPREDLVRWVEADDETVSRSRRGGVGGQDPPLAPLPKAPAYLPLDYVCESEHRLEIYRKLAQATQRGELDALRRELRDRFGVLPPPVELLVGVHELRVLAAAKQVNAIEVVDDKVKLFRGREPLTVGGYFPRLSQRDAPARLGELRKLLLAL
jgi:transcription-repair coupling factor (superfamily II helicase)